MATKVVLTFIAKEGIADNLQHQLVETINTHTPNFNGFIGGKVHRDTVNPNRIMIIEEWESAQNFKDYIGSYSDEDMSKMNENLSTPIDVSILEPSLN